MPRQSLTIDNSTPDQHKDLTTKLNPRLNHRYIKSEMTQHSKNVTPDQNNNLTSKLKSRLKHRYLKAPQH